ncbi:MAG TPA: ribosome-associated translation inhibitor RaiA [Gemmatimonadota bacterium]|nr:ribosome-associated translation inhibitor RaiA [Gemmatimonadota bacterium]
MQLIISGRNTEVTDDLRARIEEQFERLERYEPRASRAEITLWEERNRCVAEAVLSIDRRPPVHAEADAEAFRTALDRLHDKLARQLKKERSRRRDHRAPPLEALPLDEGPADDVESSA